MSNHRRMFVVALAAFLASLVPGARALEEPTPTSRVTYSNQIARIFQKSCQNCHRPGQIAPMSLLNYQEARPWAKSIKQKVVKREMPPWHADPRYGEFVNDRRLSDEEIETIVRWVDSGAPRGNPDELPEPLAFTEGWTIGEPDLILSMRRPYTVRASGRDTFEYFNIDTGLLEDRFVSAVEILPGDARVVHHVMAYVHQNDNFNFRDENSWSNSVGRGGTMLIEYAVGNKGDIFPPGSGRLLKKGSKLLLQIHYHPYGEQTKDVTRVGLRFHPRGTVHRRIITRWIGTQSISIPPNTKDVPLSSSHTFRRAVNIVSFQPHMHCRGQAMMATAYYPDGRHEILCSIPNFDFNWQTTYTFTTPPYLPAGTRLVVNALHDNTKGNPNNPNPNAHVRWGQSTFDEMMHGWTDFVYAEGEGVWPTSKVAEPLVSQAAESALEPAIEDQSQQEVVVITKSRETPSSRSPEILRHIVTASETHDSSVRTRSGWIPSFAKVATVFTVLGIGAFVVLLRR